ncbi:MAG TPA: DUF58 domain-containing protein [Rhodocyclaceae bacterium]|nr:DUF58 domain-containing protein [Rhodocyclaceae bacterium]
MPIPNRPLLWLAAAWLALGIAVVLVPALLPVWQAVGAGALVLALGDALAGRRQRGRITASRQLSRTLPVGTWQTVGLKLVAEQPCAGWLQDKHPAGFASDGLPLFFRLAAGQWIRAGYRLHITERGRHDFSGMELRLLSPLRLWLIPETLAVADEVHVYPDFARISQYTLLATDNRLSQLGVLNRRRRGEGMEFHQLRDYRQEDPPRRIDWKASARLGKLISREYQDERDQQIVFLLDCGSRMAAKDGDLSHFDHTLNALLLLAYVALNQGDAVGMLTFGHESPRYLPPRKSLGTVNQLLKGVYDLQPSRQTPDYLQAGEGLLKRLSKRAFVVLVTNLRDEDDDTLGPAINLLGRRHAITLASLREPVLEEVLAAPVTDFDAALTRGAALQYSHARRQQAAMLRQAGVQIVDVSPRELPTALINHYWERKRAGAL